MDSMHLYKRGAAWWLRFRDHRGTERRLRAFKDRRVSETTSRHVARLVECAAAGSSLTDDLADWVIQKIENGRREKLLEWGIINANQLAAGDSLVSQINTWRDGLINRGRPDTYAELRHQRAVELLVTSCDFKLFRDIDAERVQSELADWKRGNSKFVRDGLRSDYTLAHYLSAARAFTRWMIKMRRATYDPLIILPVSRGKIRNRRRALSNDEQIKLIESTMTAGVRSKIAGHERALLYRVALGTGLRVGAIRRLTVADVDGNVLHAVGSGAGNKRSSAKPMPPHLAEALQIHIVDKHPSCLLLAVPKKQAETLQADAVRAGIDIEGLDFHSLRHTFGTSMARRGVHPKTLMALMDHGTIQMTMRFYTHSFPEDEAAAVAKLPDLSPSKCLKGVAG